MSLHLTHARLAAQLLVTELGQRQGELAPTAQIRAARARRLLDDAAYELAAAISAQRVAERHACAFIVVSPGADAADLALAGVNDAVMAMTPNAACRLFDLADTPANAALVRQLMLERGWRDSGGPMRLLDRPGYGAAADGPVGPYETPPAIAVHLDTVSAAEARERLRCADSPAGDARAGAIMRARGWVYAAEGVWHRGGARADELLLVERVQ